MSDQMINLKLALDVLKSKYDFLTQADNAADAKIAALLGFEATIGVGYAFAVLQQLSGTKVFEGILGMILLLLSAIIYLYTLLPKGYKTISPTLEALLKKSTQSEEDYIVQMLSNIEGAFETNSFILKRKARLFNIALILFGASVALLILSVLGRFYV